MTKKELKSKSMLAFNPGWKSVSNPPDHSYTVIVTDGKVAMFAFYAYNGYGSKELRGFWYTQTQPWEKLAIKMIAYNETAVKGGLSSAHIRNSEHGRQDSLALLEKHAPMFKPAFPTLKIT